MFADDKPSSWQWIRITNCLWRFNGVVYFSSSVYTLNISEYLNTHYLKGFSYLFNVSIWQICYTYKYFEKKKFQFILFYFRAWLFSLFMLTNSCIILFHLQVLIIIFLQKRLALNNYWPVRNILIRTYRHIQ